MEMHIYNFTPSHIELNGCLHTLLMPQCDAQDNWHMFVNKNQYIISINVVTGRIITKKGHFSLGKKTAFTLRSQSGGVLWEINN